jgi:hypothetical protein
MCQQQALCKENQSIFSIRRTCLSCLQTIVGKGDTVINIPACSPAARMALRQTNRMSTTQTPVCPSSIATNHNYSTVVEEVPSHEEEHDIQENTMLCCENTVFEMIMKKLKMECFATVGDHYH